MCNFLCLAHVAILGSSSLLKHILLASSLIFSIARMVERPHCQRESSLYGEGLYQGRQNYCWKQPDSLEEFDDKDQLLESVASLYREAKRAEDAQEKVAAAEQQCNEEGKQVAADMKTSAVNWLVNKASRDKAKESSPKIPLPLSMADVLSK